MFTPELPISHTAQSVGSLSANLPPADSIDVQTRAGLPPRFSDLADISVTAGLKAWAAEHQNEETMFQFGELSHVLAAINEGIKTPVPVPVLKQWRDSAGLQYGDAMPVLDVAITVATPIAVNEDIENIPARFRPHRFDSTRPFVDTGIRLLFAASSQVAETPDEADDVASLSLPLRIDPNSYDEAGNFDLSTMKLHAGMEIGVEPYFTLGTRASQELFIVAQRATQLQSGQPAEGLQSPLPYAERLQEFGAFVINNTADTDDEKLIDPISDSLAGQPSDQVSRTKPFRRGGFLDAFRLTR